MEPLKGSKKASILRGLAYGLGTGVIFLSGWGLGSGRIILSQDQLFRKSVQKGLPSNLDYSGVEEVYDTLRKDFDGELDNQKLLDGLKKGLASASGDPYTEYMTADESKDFDGDLNGTFVGIGAELNKDIDGNIIIYSPLPGFPAEKAGLKAKDIIVEINDKSATGISIKEAVDQIRGEENTSVKIKVVRDKSKELVFNIARAKITIPSVTSKVLDGKIGYIRIVRFAGDTVELATKAATDLKGQNVKSVILDMRNNGGGYLDAAIKISSLWLPKNSPVLQEKRDTVVIKNYKATGNAILQNIPTIVLINEGSASASEITAGALHDNKVATLLGVKSYGKGSVQSIEKFRDGSALKVTIARWFTPAGININKEGIKPDIEVKLSDDDAKAQRDPQLEAAQKQLQ